MPAPRHCPSCQSRQRPLALECHVCGLPLKSATPRALLFQASGLEGGSQAPTPRGSAAIATPALGRVSPLQVMEVDAPSEVSFPAEQEHSDDTVEAEQIPPSFLRLARLECTEAILLALLNAFLLLVVRLSSGVPLGQLYPRMWPTLLLLHTSLSWAMFMIPITLVGQSPLMAPLGLLLESSQAERRLAFSLFHLLSVALFPLSFLCMVLTANHRTLAELLTGQEILIRPAPKLR